MKIIDHGLDKIMRETARLGDLEVAVGILEKDAGKQYPDGPTLGEVAAFNEYGTATIPARPFMSGTAAAYKQKSADVMQKQAGRVIDGTLSPQAAADDLGLWFHGRINAHIDNGPWKRNKASTIKKKGRDDPLKDTKMLYNSIDHEVRRK